MSIMVDPTTLTNIAVPVIVGGIAGMTLSMTGVDKIHAMSSQVYEELTKLSKEEFSTLASYKSVLSYTFYLIIAFFLSEVIVLGGIMLNEQIVVMVGYIVLIAALAFMLVIYFNIMHNIPKSGGEPQIIENFKNFTQYPNP